MNISGVTADGELAISEADKRPGFASAKVSTEDLEKHTFRLSRPTAQSWRLEAIEEAG